MPTKQQARYQARLDAALDVWMREKGINAFPCYACAGCGELWHTARFGLGCCIARPVRPRRLTEDDIRQQLADEMDAQDSK